MEDESTADRPATSGRDGRRDSGTGTESDRFAPLAGITGATVLAAGLVLCLRRLRRRQVAVGTGRRRRRREATSGRAERAMVTAADVPLVRWAGQELAALVGELSPQEVGGAAPVAVELSDAEGIELLWDRPVPDAPAPWAPADAGWSWRRGYDPGAPVPPDERCCPVPALLTIGDRNGRQLLVDLEAFGSIAVTGDPERVENFGHAAALELGTDDDLADTYLSTVGFGVGVDDHLRRVRPTTADDAINRLRTTAGAVEDALSDAGHASSFAHRAGGAGTYLEATVALTTRSDAAAELVAASPPRRGVAVVLLDTGDGAGSDVVAASTGATIHIDGDGAARLDPLGVSFTAAGLPLATRAAITSLLDAEAEPTRTGSAPTPPAQHDEAVDTAEGTCPPAGQWPPDTPDGGHEHTGRPSDDGPVPPPPTQAGPTSPVPAASRPNPDDGPGPPAPAVPDRAAPDLPGPDIEPDTAEMAGEGRAPGADQRLLIKVLGRPAVPDRPDIRRRETVVAAYLACHGGRAAASAVYHAVWGGRTPAHKTLWNRIAQTRAVLGDLEDGEPVMPPADRKGGALRLSDRVVTDLALLRAAHQSALDLPSSQAIEQLRHGLALVEGEPFNEAGYEWAYEEQLAVEAADLIEQAALHLVDLATDAGRPNIAREAITQGLRGVPGNEPLVRARMRLEHDLGNMAAVEAAWNELTMFLDELGMEPTDQTTTLYHQLTRSSRT